MQNKRALLQNLCLIIKVYFFWILIFIIQKPVFMLFNYEKGISLLDFFQVIWHGLKLDFCFAAYFCFIPILFCLINVFIRLDLQKIIRVYNIVFIVFISLVFAIDCVLFSYWGFRIDATLFFYLRDAKDSFSSVTLMDVVHFLIILIPYTLVLLYLNKLIFKSSNILTTSIASKVANSFMLLILLPLCVILTRGGVSTATANVGMVYYSQNQFLNLSAINPTFSLMYSLTKREDFSKEYIYMDEDKCQQIFDNLYYTEKDSTHFVLNTQRPNVLIILWESLSANAVGNAEYAKVDNKEITPGLNKLKEEGLYFSNCYANAMRTDRGIVSVLTGFLAQPTTSIIKYPNKTRSLPTLAKVFSSLDYKTSMLYGGDINFANMRSYFVSSGYEKIISSEDFPIKQKLSKWGVNDENTFTYMLNEITKEKEKYFKTFLTLSSHEPFDVSTKRFKEGYVNSLAYTDSCLFDFVEKLKQTPQWKDLLIIVVADHGYKYPYGISDSDTRKYHIPMLWLGGALKERGEIKRYVNQTDIPSTLLKQMDIESKNFVYSRNVLNPYTSDYAFFVYNNGFCFIDGTGYTTFDCNANKIISPQRQERQKTNGQALLQTLYRNIANLHPQGAL
ncbi:MAG: sulfatase-like hydrolase/transferase [Bacteroidota bacterium]|nr:sulfatase-like hydrolase/transferase [Bacteroidota bacterium]